MSEPSIRTQKRENTVSVNGKHLNFLDNQKTIPETTRITNLNTNCMELIFEYLELNDLLSIADSNKEFYSATCLIGVHWRTIRNYLSQSRCCY